MASTIAKHGLQDPVIDQVLKTTYDVAYKTIPQLYPLSAKLENVSKKVKSFAKELKFAVELEESGTTITQGDGTGPILPRASADTYRQGKATLVCTYTTFLQGGQAEALANDPQSSFLDNTKRLATGAIRRLARATEIQYHGNGSGALAFVETIDSPTTPVVIGLSRPLGVNSTVVQGPGIQYVVPDTDVAVIDPSTGTERGRCTIASVNHNNDTVTLANKSAGFDIEVGDAIVLANDHAAVGGERSNGWGAEATGLLQIVNKNDVFEDIDGSEFRRWNSIVKENLSGSVDLDELQVQEIEDQLKVQSLGLENGVDLYYTTDGIVTSFRRNAYGGDSAEYRRWDGSSVAGKKFSAGFRGGLELNGKQVMTGPFCPKGHFFGLSTGAEHMGIASAGSKTAMAKLGGADSMFAPNRDARYQFLRYFHQLIAFRRDGHFVIKNINDNVAAIR